MKKGKGKRCKTCLFFKRDKTWGRNFSKVDKRYIGYCYSQPPKLMQNIVPSVVREKGLNNLKEFSESFQFRPIINGNDPACKDYEKK